MNPFEKLDKLISNPTQIPNQVLDKLLQNENLIGGVLKAISVSSEIKDLVEHQCKQSLHSLSLAPLEEVNLLKDEVSRLEEDLQVLKEQLISLAQSSSAQLNQARNELQTANQTIQNLEQKLNQSSVDSSPTKASSSRPTWNKNMTKAQLVEIAQNNGLNVSTRLTKAQLIEKLTSHFA